MNDWTVAAIASVTAAATLLAAIAGRSAAGTVNSRDGLPVLLRLSGRWAGALAVHRHWSVPARADRILTRQLARAGLLDDFDSRHWSALLVCSVLASVVGGLVLLAWFRVPVLAVLALPLVVAWQAQAWLVARARSRTAELGRELPSGIDLLVLCLESGASLGSALRIAHEKSAEGAVRDLFASLLRQIRSGHDRASAFCRVRDQLDIPAVSGLLTSLVQADSRGMSLGPALRAQSA
ncbi:MAG: type II secretion system F family protein, partial [Steroidobacteraceae bacterium]